MDLRILIVDDDPVVMVSCLRILAAEGIDARIAENAASAESMLAAGDVFSLMITDIKMPKEDGFALIARVKVRHPDMPILIMTGYLTPEIMHKGRQSGVSGFIDKPFTPEELVTAIRKAGLMDKAGLMEIRKRGTYA